MKSIWISMKSIWISGVVGMSGSLVFPLLYHFFDYFLPNNDVGIVLFSAGLVGGSIVLSINDRFGKNKQPKEKDQRINSK